MAIDVISAIFSHLIVNYGTYPLRTFFVDAQVTHPPQIFKLETPNPDAIKARRKAKKKVELVEPESSHSTSSR